MSADAKSEKAPGTNRDKEPEDWVTGDETMTGAQASYLRTLCQKPVRSSMRASPRRKRQNVSTNFRRKRAAGGITRGPPDQADHDFCYCRA
jgi:hypothetical protein